MPGNNSLRTFENASGLISRAANWIRALQSGRSGTRRLRVSETVSLGEKRFIAVIQVDGQQYLVGGGATNVSLLAQLKGSESFGDLLKETLSTPVKKMVEQAMEQTRERA
jgi:flagellar biogenesis protein FliO